MTEANKSAEPKPTRLITDFVKEFLEDSPFDEDVWAAFAQGLFYVAGDITDAWNMRLFIAR